MAAAPQFDEIIRNLLVYLKGQVPSLQSRTNTDDLTRQVQSIVATLRTTITQVEVASSFDPRDTPEFKAILHEQDQLKKTNHRLEEQLFTAIDKSEKLQGENTRLNQEVLDARNRSETNQKQSQLQGQLETQVRKLETDLRTKVAEKDAAVAAAERSGYNKATGEFQVRIDKLQKQLAERDEALREALHAREKLLREAMDTREKSITDLEAERTKILIEREKMAQTHLEEKRSLEIAKAGLETLKAQLEASSGNLEESNRNLRAQLLEAESQLRLTKEEVAKLRETLSNIEKRPPVSLEVDQKRIRDLEIKIESLKRELSSSSAMEVYRNIQAAAEAKVAFLEKTLAETRVRLREAEDKQPEASELRTKFQQEKDILQSRISELEGTVRRLLTERFQGEGAETAPEKTKEIWQAQEILFMFELMQNLLEKLPSGSEYKDLRNRTEQALKLLEKSNSLEVIPTLGHAYTEEIHKVVRAFSSSVIDDGTIVSEMSRGFRLRNQILKKPLVWVVKSRFRCTSCSAQCRPQDYFCPKCGLEICAPDGTPKRRLPPLPVTTDLILPLIDSFISQNQIEKAKSLLDQLGQEHPNDPELLKRRVQLGVNSPA